MQPAIETYYKGHRFRSRLEARWAALFDLLDWQWTYEPIDAHGYIPDFLVHGHKSFIAEVGPCITPADYITKAEKTQRGLNGVWGGNTVVLGVEASNGRWENWAGYYLPTGPMAWGGFSDFDENTVRWITCNICDQPAIHHAMGDFTAMPCGHSDGDHHLGGSQDIRVLWGIAHEATRWRAA